MKEQALKALAEIESALVKSGAAQFTERINLIREALQEQPQLGISDMGVDLIRENMGSADSADDNE